jgi:glycosyltransferase involved in cell wall biosynthesis
VKILLIAYYFPPRNTVASHRLHSFAYYWQAAGHQVTVIAPGPVAGDSSLELPENGYEVHRVSRSSFHQRVLGAERQTNAAENPARGSLKRLVLSAVSTFTRRRGVFRELRMPSFADLWRRPALHYIKTLGQTWDMVISSSHPYVTHRIAAAIKRSGMATRWAADFRDPWTASDLYPGLPLFRIFEAAMERRVFRDADVITTVGRVLADQWLKRFGRRPCAVFNGFSELEEDPSIDPEPKQPGTYRIVYTGALYAGKRDPEALLAAVAKLQDLGEDIGRLEILFAGGHGDILLEQIARFGLEDTVRYLGNRSHTEALALQRSADALLFIESGKEEDRGNITGKIFEYIRSGRRVLSLGIREDSEAWGILSRTGTAILLGKNNSIEDQLNSIMREHPVSGNNSGISEFSRRNQAEIFLELLDT